jgi:cytochrome c biogenesis protein
VKLGPLGWARWFWRQLTSMRTALFLLLLLALAAVPGSLVPQHSSDPNGVTQWKIDHPFWYPVLNKLQVFDTYSSVWFSAIYLLLFVSLIGCIIPRVKHHVEAMLAQPPRTPARLARMAGFRSAAAPEGTDAATAVAGAQKVLKSSGYRTVVFAGPREASVSAERGYLRETGNLVFHIALLGVLVVVGIGGGFGWTAQRVVAVGQTFVDTNVNLDSFNPGRFVDGDRLPPYSVRLDKLDVTYDASKQASGLPLDYDASVTATGKDGGSSATHIKVNHPLRIDGTSVYLLGNGYAPVLTFRNAAGKVVSSQTVPFLPTDNSTMLSQGVVKVSDGLPKQLGIVGIFMPTASALKSGQLASSYPGLRNPRVSLTVYSGDLGLDSGAPQSVYALDTSKLTQIAGPTADTGALSLGVGQTAQLPGGMGSVSFDRVVRYASLDIHHDPTQGWVLVFAILILAGLLTSLFVPRRRMWVKAKTDASGHVTLEYAGLARGEDPRLDEAVEALASAHRAALGDHATVGDSTNSKA